MLRAELAAYLGVVGISAGILLIQGIKYSAQFAQGGTWDGRAPGLRPSNWWPGQSMDLSDDQWRTFRSSLLPLACVLLAHACLRGMLTRSARWQAITSLLMGLAFAGYLHGVALTYVLGLALAGFGAAQGLAGCKHGVLALWTSHMAALLAVRLTEGFRGLDSGAHRGPVRWEICYNMTLLRMLSYSLDLHWRRSRAAVLAASEKVLWGYLQGLPSCASH